MRTKTKLNIIRADLDSVTKMKCCRSYSYHRLFVNKRSLIF